MSTTRGSEMSQDAYDGPTGWTGWIGFAAIMMVIVGALNMFYGLIAILNDDWVVWNNTAAVYVDLSAWGWALVIIGFVVLGSGIGVLSGNVVARTVGVIVAAINLVANFFLIPVHPWWSLTVIVIDVLVIWALTAHGREMRDF